MQHVLIFWLSRFIQHGQLTIQINTGQKFKLRGKDTGPNDLALSISLRSSRQLLRLLLRPDPVCGELYVDGDLKITSGNLGQFMNFLFINGHHWQNSPAGKLIGQLHKLTAWWRTINPVARSKRNVAHHYDLTDQLFDLFLDSQRQYSCAYFAEETDDLEMAQNRKIARLAAKLNLTENHRILDIGCGWGGLATALSILSPKSHVTGITLSEKQYRYFKQAIDEQSSHDRLAVFLQDYRTLKDRKFDRIVSVGMLEHVGRQQFNQFFSCVDRYLSPDGVAVIHAIGRFGKAKPTSPWIDKYIFPGGYLPNLEQITRAVENTRLKITDVEIMRIHYAKTLSAWRRAFEENKSQLTDMYDERFIRLWRFYLLSCENYFAHGCGMVFQIQLTHRQDAVPLTRAYIAEKEVQFTDQLCQITLSGK